jgi:Transposase DDE domain
MTVYPNFVKGKLTEILSKMATEPMLFVKNPNVDFTRKRKLSFETIMKLMLSMGGHSLTSELMEYFDYDVDMASSSAFIQQRNKLSPYAFEFLFNEFTHSFQDLKTYEGYRLLAVDGSDLNICHNPNDADTYFQSIPNTKGFNQLHLNAMYDLCNKLFVDVCIQPARKENEFRALSDMTDRSDISGDVIVVADRGYESYNVFAHIEKKGWKYAIRVKDIMSNGILSALKLPVEDEFDVSIHRILTRKQTKFIKSNPEVYKYLPQNVTFDYLDKNTNIFYPMTLRVVRFKILDDTYETIITNLDSEKFPPKKIKELYHLRWGIETSFRELKYAIGLISFHSKKVEHITQEIFARLVMYNFCELITMHVVIQQKDTKHCYQVNFTRAIQVCKHFFKCQSNISPPDVEALIRKNILPIREGRKDPRKIRAKAVVSFLYRVA